MLNNKSEKVDLLLDSVSCANFLNEKNLSTKKISIQNPVWTAIFVQGGKYLGTSRGKTVSKLD